MDISAVLFCLGIIPIGIGIFFLARYFIAGKKKSPSIGSAERSETSRQGWKRWIPFFVIALILAFWTIWGALFFLAVVWLLRKNPYPDAHFAVGNSEKKTARRVYTWLFFSPFITVPIFLGMLLNLSFTSSSTNDYTLAALIPLVMHIPLLLGLTSKSTFVYRHTQQGILVISLRAGIASLAASALATNEGLSLGLFLLGNGALWFIGSISGWDQISKGRCWFMERKGEKMVLPGSAEQTNPVQAQEIFLLTVTNN